MGAAHAQSAGIAPMRKVMSRDFMGMVGTIECLSLSADWLLRHVYSASLWLQIELSSRSFNRRICAGAPSTVREIVRSDGLRKKTQEWVTSRQLTNS